MAIVFAQTALSAYACPVQNAAAPFAVTNGPEAAAVAKHPCAGMATEPASTQTNVCEVHCTDGVTLPASPDMPPVALAALPALAIPLAALAASEVPDAAPFAARSGAPPLTLQFCRLLN